MLLTITTTHRPATDLGYLLHKNPAHTHTVELTFGRAHVFYSEADDARCTAALLLDVDPIGLVRGRPGTSPAGHALEPYVNDRPYVASSFLSVALSRCFGTTLSGRSRERPELVDQALPLVARIAALPCRGGERFLQNLFEPLGYEVAAQPHLLDEQHPDWGQSPYHTVELRGNVTLRELLTHLYVLVPVLDDGKHYWVGSDEVEKLLRKGEGWLSAHPEREAIVSRYLKRQRHLTRDALARLVVEEDVADPDADQQAKADEEAAAERPLRLNEQRLDHVVTALKAHGVRRVLDLGCGDGKLVRLLARDRGFDEIVALDVSVRALQAGRDRLNLDRMPPKVAERIRLLQGSLMYRDRRLEGFDGAAVVEVIEHLDMARLRAFERVLFEFARPGVIVLTTPNVEYNVRFENLPAGRFRHRDHRFEWTRREFATWAADIAARFRYEIELDGIGPNDPEVGAPTQVAVFTAARTASIDDATEHGVGRRAGGAR